ncbi:hypothetical protein J4408_03815 [Candidatus Pacearchaeota archaeon]|nr:hypothetical protein [Candidatus Pacearchaeota archaeon]
MVNKIVVPRENLSDYLTEGMRHERYHLYLLDSEDEKIITEAKFFKTHKDAEGYSNPFGAHLSHISALNVISQSIIAYYCKKLGKTKYELGEFLGRESFVKMLRPVSLESSVRCIITPRRTINLKSGFFGNFDYSINEGCFQGRISGIIPLKI